MSSFTVSKCLTRDVHNDAIQSELRPRSCQHKCEVWLATDPTHEWAQEGSKALVMTVQRNPLWQGAVRGTLPTPPLEPTE